MPVLALSPSTPCWRSVGMIAARSVSTASRNSRRSDEVDSGSGTIAANFSQSSNGDSLIPVVPSDHGRVNIYSYSYSANVRPST